MTGTRGRGGGAAQIASRVGRSERDVLFSVHDEGMHESMHGAKIMHGDKGMDESMHGSFAIGSGLTATIPMYLDGVSMPVRP